MKREQKSLTNKGFSLVELIIVVAIMAVLIGVLAPQYLRYVEKSRLQKDNTSISEVANVIKMASAEEAVVTQLQGGGTPITVTYTFDSTGMQGVNATTPTALDTEILATITPAEVKVTSSTYGGGSTAPNLQVTIDANNQIKVSSVGWMDSPTATASTAADPKVF